MSGVIFFIFFLQIGGASQGRACYQLGLPRLVLIYLQELIQLVTGLMVPTRASY